MSHVDPERLALLAMGESILAAEESEHLAACAACVDELAALRHAALAGRATLDVGELESPPEAVWQRIASELSLGGSASATAPPAAPPAASPVEPADTVAAASPVEPADTVAAPAPAPAASTPAAPPAASTPGQPAASSASSAPRTGRRAGRRAWALAAAFALVAGAGLGTWAIARQASSTTDIAEASLAPFPTHDGAEGTATVEEQADGTLSLTVELSADAAPDTYREVWLITADASALVSLGVLDGTSASFAVPQSVDLRDYVLVDISQEPVDGDPSHSGDSIVRGELSFL